MNSEDACNIRVVCRVRPLNNAEVQARSEFLPKFPIEGQIHLSVSLQFLIFVGAAVDYS